MITNYILDGQLTVGTSTITVICDSFSTTFDATVTEKPSAELSSITATYTQNAVVTPRTPLDDLKTELVVTANYSDGSTANVTDYSLSGVLTVGTSTITVTHKGKTATFTVNVIADIGYTTDGLAGYYDLTTYSNNDIGELYIGEDYTGSCPLYALDLIEKSGVSEPLTVRAYTKNTDNLSDATLGGFENGEFRSTYVSRLGGEGLYTAIGVTELTYPMSIEWYGKFCGGISDNTDNKDTYDFPLQLFTSRATINNISSLGGSGSTLTLNDSTTLNTSGAAGEGSDTITLSKPIDKDIYHHFVVCYTLNSFKLYVDSELLGTSSVRQNDYISMITPMTGGTMKMLRLYRSILTDSQVARNYNDVLTTFGGGN